MLMRGRYVITQAELGETGILHDAAIHITHDKIDAVGSYEELKRQYPGDQVLGTGRQLLMPGLIDAHTHGAGLSFVQRGVDYDYLETSLLDFECAAGLSPELNSQLNAVRHLRNGCTTIHQNNWTMPLYEKEVDDCAKMIEAYQKTGIRLAFSPGTRNKNLLAYDDEAFYATLPEDLQKKAAYLLTFDKQEAAAYYLQCFDALYNRYNGGRVRLIYGPNWVQGATDAFLQQVGECAKARGNLPIHLHTLQTPVQKIYGLRTYGKSLVGHLDELGLVRDNLVLGHAVYLDAADIELLGAKNASVTHHPSCNLATRNGIAPVYEMVRRGVNVCLGIDEKGINDDEDILMEMRMAFFLHRVPSHDLNTPALTAFDILKMATQNSARAVGYPGEIGAIAPGMQADAILVDLEEILEEPWASPEAKIQNLLLYRGLGRHVNTVVVAGTPVLEDRVFKTVDVKALYAEAAEQASRGRTPEQEQYRALLQGIKPYYVNWYNAWLREMDQITPFYPLNSRR